MLFLTIFLAILAAEVVRLGVGIVIMRWRLHKLNKSIDELGEFLSKHQPVDYDKNENSFETFHPSSYKKH